MDRPSTLSAEPFPRRSSADSREMDLHVAQDTGRTDRVLNGEKPANLPVIVSNRFQMVLNMTTAKGLGLAGKGEVVILAGEYHEFGIHAVVFQGPEPLLTLL